MGSFFKFFSLSKKKKTLKKGLGGGGERRYSLNFISLELLGIARGI